MRKAFIKSISFLLALVILFALPISGKAADNSTFDNEFDNVKFTTILNYSSNIIKSGITVTCKAKLNSVYSTNLKIVMTLQKNTSSGYTDVKTWTTTGVGTYLDAEEARAINILYTYRLKVTFTAGNESVTTYSYY